MTPIKAAAEPSREELRKRYAEDWRRQIINAGGDENVAQQAVALAALNGLFDHLSTPAGNAGVREALEFYSDPFGWKKKHDPDDVVRIPDFYSETSFGDTAQVALAALTQPRETSGDEIKRVVVAPPEASFDNASDMLGYLNAPREAGPVTPITNPLVLPAGIKAGDYASPSPIPEVPVGRDPATIEACALVAEGFDAACDSPRMKLFVDAGLVIAVYKRDGEIGQAIRALKPQDGGNCEHGIAKVNCGICVPSKVFSGESGS